MARETKQDRTVRAILDQTTEHLHELKTLEANSSTKELDVERWAQSFIRNCLGFTSSGGYSIRAQETKGKMRPDLVILQGEKPIFVVEVKKLGFDLNKADFRSGKAQLSEYLNLIGNVQWGMLTNGVEWKLFDFSQPQYGGIEISNFDLKADGDVIDVSKKAVEEQCYELLDLHETTFTAKGWPELSREAMAFSPESLSKAILSADVVRYIAKFVKGEYEFKANHEILTDRLYCLLEQGLNDAIIGWNEAKAAEIQKYVKSQKRASRKTKKSKRETQNINEPQTQPQQTEPSAVNEASDDSKVAS
ncbi:MAG: type I restriction enzyme HsdR N-terminal domain-containing protein [Bdellovibrio sp.]|nr:type I restriction enzyme HsdR N-terminal domain-containing protein [Bdellovibrio sp.]